MRKGEEKIIFFILAFLFLSSSVFYSDETKSKEEAEEEVLAKAEQVIKLIEKYKNANDKEKQKIIEELKLNREFAVSFLESKIIEKGCSDYLQMLKVLLNVSESSESEEFDVEKLNKLITKLSQKKDAKAIEKYFAEKMLFAMKLYRLGEYDKALNIVNSILCLEKKLSFDNELHALRSKIEEKIIATTVILPIIRTEGEIFEIGDKIKIVLEIHNLTTDVVTLKFIPDEKDVENTASAGQKQSLNSKTASSPVNANIILNYTEYDPFGNSFSTQRNEIFLITENKSLTASEVWKREIIIDTALDNPQKPVYRTYTINCELRPFAIKTPTKSYIRKIVFPPKTLKVFPPDINPVLENPLKYFSRALDGENANDIFMCSLLIPEKYKKHAIEMLIKGLPKANNKGKIVLMNCLRHITNEKIPFDEEEWYKYWERICSEEKSAYEDGN